MIGRIAAAAALTGGLVAGIGTAVHAEGRGSQQCQKVTYKTIGLAPTQRVAELMRENKTQFFTNTVTMRYSEHRRIGFVSAVPKHC